MAHQQLPEDLDNFLKKRVTSEAPSLKTLTVGALLRLSKKSQTVALLSTFPHL